MSLPRPLTPEQCAFFRDEGYLIIPDVFDPQDLEPVRQALHREIAAKALELKAQGKLENLHEDLAFDYRLAAIQKDSAENSVAIMRHLEGLRGGGFHAVELFDLIAHKKLLAKVGSLLATEEIVASSVYRVRPKLPNSGRGIVPWHQDSGYFAEHCDTQMIITCWVPLVDATVENGCMQILPRVHRGKVAKHHTGGNAGFLVIKDEDLPDDPQKAITAACPRGGVVFMTNRTPHCSTPNTSDHIRWSMDLRFQSAETPSNVGLEPTALNEQGEADAAFYDKVSIACYPPEADFLVASKRTPELVTDYSNYARRRELYDRTKSDFSAYRRWRQEAPATV
ncbi:phytanoyl-CoA dioxygenase family protein [Oleiharenicola lentus]|uniref:phytanoyl-CoA dioxygenase family protein n=1 Tax=Oleiharenicola lentus TaxID=2508720 RepID=UPI003F66EF7C